MPPPVLPVTDQRAGIPSPGAAVAEAAHVAVSIAGVPVLRDLSLRVGPGEVVGITGRNGTGKSTLLRLLATLLAPAAGRVAVLDHALPAPVPASLRRRIALVGHTPALHPNRTLREELELAAAVLAADRSAARALEFVGLTAAAGRRGEACSQGMRRRADLARAWLGAPDLLLLDEPEAGLDVDAGPVVDTLVAEVRARAGGVVLVGHDRHRLDQLADRVLYLSSGRLWSRVQP